MPFLNVNIDVVQELQLQTALGTANSGWGIFCP